MIRIVVRSNPLEDGYLYSDVPSGPALSEMLGTTSDQIYVELNGDPVPSSDLETTFPIDGDFVVVIMTPKTFGIVEGILAALSAQLAAAGLTTAAAVVAPTTAVSVLGVSIGTVGALVSQALVMGMSMALTALVKPQTPSMKPSVPNRFYSLTDGSNSPSPYQVLPKLYGTFRMTPPLAGNFYTAVSGNDQYLLGLFCLGYGPIQLATKTGVVIVGDSKVVTGAKHIIQDGKKGGNALPSNNVAIDPQAIWIGQSSFANYGDVVVQIGIADAIMRPGNYAGLAGNGQGFENMYTREVEEVGLSFELNTPTDGVTRGQVTGLVPELESVSRITTTGENPISMSLDLLFPLGLYSQDRMGKENNNVVQFKLQWSREGQGNWVSPSANWPGGSTSSGVITIHNNTGQGGKLDAKWRESQRLTVQFKIADTNVPLGQRYDIKLTRTHSLCIRDYIKYIDDVTWTSLRTYKENHAWNVLDPYLEVDKHVLLMSIKVKASGTISGSLDTVTVAGQSVLKTVESIGTDGKVNFKWKPTNNPAWAYADVLQGFQLDAARRVADDQIDWKRLKEWARWCEDPYTTLDCTQIGTPSPTDPNEPDPMPLEQKPIKITVTVRFPDGLYAISNGSLQSSGVRIKPEWKRAGATTWTSLETFDVSGIWPSAHTSYRAFTIDDPTAKKGTKYVIRLTRIATWYRENLASKASLQTKMNVKSVSVSQDGKTLETITVAEAMNTKIPWIGNRATGAYGAWIDEPASGIVVTVALGYKVPDPSVPGEPLPPGESGTGPAPRFPVPGDGKFDYNWYHLDDETMLDRLRAISSTGRSSWALIDGLFSIVQDNNFDPVQMITPRNSKGLEISRSYPKVPDALRVRYISTASWSQAEKLVLDDWVFIEKTINVNGTNVLKLVDAFGNVLGNASDREKVISKGYRPAEIFETLETQGVVDRLVANKIGSGYYRLADQAFREGRYYLAVAHLRTETYKVEMGVDNLVANRGDCVYLSHDVLAVGKIFGRILDVVGMNLFLDQTIEDEGLDYSIRVRKGNGQVVVYRVTISEEYENMVSLATGDDGIKAGDLFALGIADKDTVMCKVVNIEYKSDLSATVTMVPAAPEIQCADQGFVVDSMAAGIADDVEEDEIVGIASITGAPILDSLTANYDSPVLIDDTTVGAWVTLTWTVPSASDPIQTLAVYYTDDDWETSGTMTVSAYDSSKVFPVAFPLGSTVEVWATGTTAFGNTTEQSNTIQLVLENGGALVPPRSFQLYPNNWEVSLMWVQPWDLPATDPAYVRKPISYKGTEVFYSYVNDHTAVDAGGNLLIQQLATTEHPYGTHLNLTADVVYYYWIRNVDVSGNPSNFFPNNPDHSGLAGSPTQDVAKYFQLLDDWNNLSGPVYQDLGARLNALEGNP